MFQTPILFLIFNRPDTTLKVFKKIRECKPKKLFKDMTSKEQAKARKATKAGIKLGEGFIQMYETMALPTKRLRSAQERYIRGEYKKFNRMRKLVGLKPKRYKRFNSRGKPEVVV